MAVSAGYYGPESSWFNLPPDSNLSASTYNFKVPAFYSSTTSSNGDGMKAVISAKFIKVPTSYQVSVDKSCCWCETDGTAPFDQFYYLTSYSATHDRYEVNRNGACAIGLKGASNSSNNLTNQTAVYWSNSGVPNNCPLAQKKRDGSGYITPNTFTDGGNEYARVAYSRIIPYLKFDFSSVFYTPIVHYYVLKDTATLEQYGAVTTPSDYNSLVKTEVYSDLYSFCKDIENNAVSDEKIVIISVFAYARYIKWNEDKTIADFHDGTDAKNYAAISPLILTKGLCEFSHINWANEQQEELQNESFSLQLTDNGPITGQTTVGSSSGGTLYGGAWTEANNSKSSATISANHLICISGLKSSTGVGYFTPSLTASGGTSAHSIYQSCVDSTSYTIKNLGDGVISKKTIGVYATLGDFGGIRGFREYVRRSCAYLGSYFSEYYYPNWTHDLNQESCFLGTIDSAGITHGAYTNGLQNDNQPQKTWGDDWASKTPFKPGGTPSGPANDPNKTSNKMAGKQNLALFSATTKYCGDGVDVDAIFRFCNNVKGMEQFIETDPDTQETHLDYDGYRHWIEVNFLNSNPIDNIVSVKWYPFNTKTFIGAAQKSTVKLGRTYVNNTGAGYSSATGALEMYSTSYPNVGNTLELGFFQPLEAYGDFRDYAPYSECTIYLPYCGTTTFPTSYCLGHAIYISYKVDIVTGSCTAIVALDSYDGNIICTGHGTIGTEIPFSGIQSANYQAGIYQGIQSLKSAQLSQKQNLFSNGCDIVKQTAGFINSANALNNPLKDSIKTWTGIVSSTASTLQSIGNTMGQYGQDKYSIQ